MKRTVLIANTSDMPVAAREASIYTGITIAEYYPGHGLRRGRHRRLHLPLGGGPAGNVRPSGRDARRRRATRRTCPPVWRSSTSGPGRWNVWAQEDRAGAALPPSGAVSPPGGDISEPVSPGHHADRQGVLVPWTSALAYARHFPAIDWLQSYSLYLRLGCGLIMMRKWLPTGPELVGTAMEHPPGGSQPERNRPVWWGSMPWASRTGSPWRCARIHPGRLPAPELLPRSGYLHFRWKNSMTC